MLRRHPPGPLDVPVGHCDWRGDPLRYAMRPWLPLCAAFPGRLVSACPDGRSVSWWPLRALEGSESREP